MHTKLAFILEIGVILFAANIGGLISRKLKQPAVLGQIIAGIVLGLGMMEKTAMIEHMGGNRCYFSNVYCRTGDGCKKNFRSRANPRP